MTVSHGSRSLVVVKMMTAAMDKFSCNDDLLHCLGENIKSTRLLYALCLTSKLFNACFTPFLYRSVATHAVHYGRVLHGLEDDQDDAEDDGQEGTGPASHCDVCDDRWPPRGVAYDIDLDRNSNVRHVRKLQVGLSNEFDDRAKPGILDRLLSKIPMLEHLEVTTPGDVNLLHLITFRHPGLKSLSFACDDTVHDQARKVFPGEKLNGPEPAVNFGTFTKLTSLSLTGIRTNGTVSGTDVVNMLLAAPRLRELALDCYVNAQEPGDIPERWNAINFIHDLCQLYGESGGTPLKLRRLQLGRHTRLLSMRRRMWLMLDEAFGETDRVLTSGDIPHHHGQPTAPYLEKLCDLSALEELSVDNCSYSISGIDWGHTSKQVWAPCFAWETFTKERAPRLRRLWVTELDDDVFNWIRDHVAVTDGYGDQMAISYGDQVQEYSIQAGLLDKGWRPKELEFDVYVDIGQEAIDHIVACGGQLEGLTLVPSTFEADHECKVYGGLIAQLPSLKVFRLGRMMSDEWDHLRDLKGSFSEPDLVLLTHLVPQSSSLRYIMVGAFAWSIARNQDGHAVKLVAMSSSEWEDIELFRPHPFLHLYDKQKHVPQKGYRLYQRVPWSPRRPPDWMLPQVGAPRRSNAKYA